MSIDDFFLVYSGSVSAFELTRMFFQHRIVIENHDFSKVKSFASSFDYSTAKWNEFYSVMEKRKEVVVKFLVDCRVGSVVTVYFLFPFTSSIFCESSPLQPVLTLLSSFLSLLGVRCLFISTYHFIPCLRTLTSVLSLLFSGGFATRVPSTLEKTQTKSARIRDDLLSEATYLEAQQLLRLHNEKKSLQKKQWYFREMAFLVIHRRLDDD